LISFSEYHLDFRIRIPHTPKIRAMINPDNAYKMEWGSLFADGTQRKDVFACPGSTAWHRYCSRVSTYKNLR